MIQSLTIENFKCFNQLNTINLNTITILAGSNGVGKSSVIQSLLLLRQTIENHKLGFGSVKLNDIYNLNLGNSKIVTSSLSNSKEIALTLKTMDKTYLFKYDSDVVKTRFNLDIKHIDSIEDTTSIFANEFYYLQAERLGPRDSQKMTEQTFDNVGCSGEFTNYIFNKLEMYQIEESRMIGEVNNLKQEVESWMNLIVPGVQFNTEAYDKLKEVGLGIRRKGSDTDYLQPSNIGFGISYVLPIIITCLIAKKGSMVIIENPEAHLHPSGQSKMGAFLAKMANSGLQIIIETHSEHIINGIRVSSLHNVIPNDSIYIDFFNMKQEDSEPTIINITVDEKGSLSDWPEGFFDQHEKDIAEIFKKRVS
jgi:predicted ATPase